MQGKDHIARYVSIDLKTCDINKEKRINILYSVLSIIVTMSLNQWKYGPNAAELCLMTYKPIWLIIGP